MVRGIPGFGLEYNIQAPQVCRGTHRGLVRIPFGFTQINNYGCFGNNMMIGNCYCHDHDCGGGSSWLQNLTGFLGAVCMAIAPWIGGGGGGSRVETGTEKPAEQPADEFAGLKNMYPNGRFAKIGDTYCAIINDVRYEGTSMDDLLSKIPRGNEITAHPEQPAVDNDDDEHNNDDTINGNNNHNDDDTVNGNNHSNAGNSVRAKIKVPEGWGQTHLSAEVQRSLGNSPSVDDVIAKMDNFDGITTKGMSSEQIAKLRQALIDSNPSCFNAYGSCNVAKFDWSKLDLPSGKILKDTFGAKNCEKPKGKTKTKGKTKPKETQNTNNTWKYSSSGQYTYNNGKDVHIKYKGTQNSIHQKNGNSSLDDDAIFTINGKQYTIICTNGNESKKKKLDYCEITGQRFLGSDFTLIHPETGKFNPTRADMSWTYTNHDNGRKEPRTFRLLPTNGGEYIDIYCKNGQVYMKQGHNEYLADDVMLGKHKF